MIGAADVVFFSFSLSSMLVEIHDKGTQGLTLKVHTLFIQWILPAPGTRATGALFLQFEDTAYAVPPNRSISESLAGGALRYHHGAACRQHERNRACERRSACALCMYVQKTLDI